MRLVVSRTILTIALAAVACTPAVYGQKKTQAPHEPPAAQSPAAKAPRENGPAGPKGAKGPDAAARPMANPYNAVDRWNAMNPKQRERLLERMPADKRQQFLDKIHKFNALPKQEQQMMREQYERLSHLPPDQQQVVRRDLAKFNNLPPARQQAMNQEFLKLRKMSESERNTHLSSPEFRDKFYPAEQQMIGDLTKVLSTRK